MYLYLLTNLYIYENLQSYITLKISKTLGILQFKDGHSYDHQGKSCCLYIYLFVYFFSFRSAFIYIDP